MTQTRKQQEQTGDNHGKDHAGKYLEEYPEVFTGDERYGIIEEDILKDKEKGKVISMCEVLDRAENHGIKKGVSQGISQEKEHGIKSLVESLRKFNISDMGIIEELIDKYSLSKTAARKYL